jgi:hypothetical protein
MVPDHMTQIPGPFQTINNSELQLVTDTQAVPPLHSKDYAFYFFGLIYDSYHLFLYLPKSFIRMYSKS